MIKLTTQLHSKKITVKIIIFIVVITIMLMKIIIMIVKNNK